MNFNIKDLLIHIIHGGIIACAAVATLNTETFEKIKPIFSKDLSSFFNFTLLLIGCYLVGLFLDALSDFIWTYLYNRFDKWGNPKTKNIKKFFGRFAIPSFFLLTKGEKWKLRLAHNKMVNKILIDDAIENGEEKKNLETSEYAERLFNYAKNRAFKYGMTYQLERIEAYFRLSIFFRNIILTILLSTVLLFVGFSVG
jgi:hypothetical protein